jgi:hypothetical protein
LFFFIAFRTFSNIGMCLNFPRVVDKSKHVVTIQQFTGTKVKKP